MRTAPSLGRILGWISVSVGVVYLGLGLANVWRGQEPEGIDGLLFGGIAFIAGCVILHRRRRATDDQPQDSSES